MAPTQSQVPTTRTPPLSLWHQPRPWYQQQGAPLLVSPHALVPMVPTMQCTVYSLGYLPRVSPFQFPVVGYHKMMGWLPLLLVP